MQILMNFIKERVGNSRKCVSKAIRKLVDSISDFRTTVLCCLDLEHASFYCTDVSHPTVHGSYRRGC